MNEKDYSHLRHMLEAAQTATYIAKNESEADLDEHITVKLALAKAAEIVGNSASKVSEATKSDYPAVDWGAAIALGPKPATQTGMNYATSALWRTVTEVLPPLVTELQRIIDEVHTQFPDVRTED